MARHKELAAHRKESYANFGSRPTTGIQVTCGAVVLLQSSEALNIERPMYQHIIYDLHGKMLTIFFVLFSCIFTELAKQQRKHALNCIGHIDDATDKEG